MNPEGLKAAIEADVIEGLRTTAAAAEGLTDALGLATDAFVEPSAALAPYEPTRMEQIAAGFIENRGLTTLKGKVGDGKGDMYRLVSVLSPTEIHTLCAIIWGYTPLNILAVYRGLATGEIVHAFS